MSSKIEVSRETLERWAYDMRLVSPIGPELREILAAPVVERQPDGYIQGIAQFFVGKDCHDRKNGYIVPIYLAPPELAELQADTTKWVIEVEKSCARSLGVSGRILVSALMVCARNCGNG